jgi:hypothetical protein
MTQVKRISDQYMPPGSRWGEYYTVQICPACETVLNEHRARYVSRCCYYCGHTNAGVLFETKRVVVRDLIVNGELIATVVK